MRFILLAILTTILTTCSTQEADFKSIVISGITPKDTQYLLIGGDTLKIDNNTFKDTILIKENVYDYIQLSNWKWPRLIYLDRSKSLKIDFSGDVIKVSGDKLNNFLLNSENILNLYSLRWDMKEEIFRNTITSELSTNFDIIDSVLLNSGIDNKIIKELKAIEKLKVAHRTANFISFQERKENFINRNIYEFIDGIDLNNERLEKQENNRNFQYYYLLDKVSDDVPDSIYPFAVIDTVNKYSTINSIRRMIITSTVKSSFYSEEVDHRKLISEYQDNFGNLSEDDDLFILKEKIQRLKPGNTAPSIGELENVSGELTTIEDFNDKNILITVWGTWCPYCKEELPALKELINKYSDNFTSLGISLDEDKDKWKTYIKENNWKGIHLNDPIRNSVFKSNYLVNGTNVHLLINKDGTIVSSKTLKPSFKELEELISMME